MHAGTQGGKAGASPLRRQSKRVFVFRPKVNRRLTQLSAMVAIVARAACKPKQPHGGVQPCTSKCWASGTSTPADSDDDCDEEIIVEEDDLSTPEFIAMAKKSADLEQAEKELSSPNQVGGFQIVASRDPPLSKRSIATMVNSRLKGRPWQRALPPSRVSPQRTLETCWMWRWSSFKAGSRVLAPAYLNQRRQGRALQF